MRERMGREEQGRMAWHDNTGAPVCTQQEAAGSQAVEQMGRMAQYSSLCCGMSMRAGPDGPV